MSRLRGAVSLLMLFAATGATQNPPVTNLTTPATEFPEGFTRISGLRELRDGRVLVIEQCERLVKLVDFQRGTLTPVGRSGAGPREYRTPARLLALAGDSSALYDPGNRRYLIIRADGSPGGFFDALSPVTERRDESVFTTFAFNPVGSDAQGRLYARESGIIAGPSGRERADSVAVLRWDPTTGRIDSVAFHRLVGPPGPIKPTDPREPPFTTGVQWAVALDGTVALVHPRDYHVEFISADGTRTTGNPIPFTPVPVDEAHKQQWRDSNEPACNMPRSGEIMIDGKAVRYSMMATPEPDTWPTQLPPFLGGAAAFASDGMLWVLRTGRGGAPPTYDVIDRRGRVAHRVVLPARARLAGFGKGAVYIVRLDDDDLQFLQRHPLPAVSAR